MCCIKCYQHTDSIRIYTIELRTFYFINCAYNVHALTNLHMNVKNSTPSFAIKTWFTSMHISHIHGPYVSAVHDLAK
jgi:hypothetical protein